MISFIAIIVTFGLVIFIHELGHFIMAKQVGVCVEKFSVGFGPEIAWFTKGETRYSVRLIPLGGFVKMAGEEYGQTKGNEREFFSQKWYRRSYIIAAGPLMNFVLGIVIFWIMFMSGVPAPDYSTSTIGEVVDEMPAHKVGLLSGDRIVKIDEKSIETWDQMSTIIHNSAERILSIDVIRNGEKLHFDITPQYDSELEMGLIGIAPRTVTERFGVIESLLKSVQSTYWIIKLTLIAIGKMIVGAIKPELAGPIGIMQMVGEKAHSGILSLVSLIALISISLGLFNLFPIPILDGGHLMFVFWEGVTGRPVSVEKMKVAQTVGLVILLTIFVFATYKDGVRLFSKFTDKQGELGIESTTETAK